MQKIQVRCLSQEDALEKEMATHSSILPWEISWTEEPVHEAIVHGGHRVRPNLPTKQQEQSTALGQALPDPETAKANERWRPSSTQVRGKD